MSNDTITKERYFERQLAALGKFALNKIHGQKILLVNLKAVGCEVAKNMALESLSLLTIIDDNNVSEEDLDYCFFFKRCNLGQRKSSVLKEKLSSMNKFTNITEGSSKQ